MDLKKSTLALLALGLTGVASAGGFMPAPACTNHPVTVPCERSAWDLGFTGYWARPTSNFGSLFGYTGRDDGAIDLDDIVSRSHNKDHKFGFGLEASYHWGTGNDLNLNWTRFHKSENYTFDELDSEDVVTDRVDVRFDTVNLELGQQINVGANWDLRAHMGLSWARIDITATDDDASSSSNLANGNFERQEYISKVDGVGPRVGWDAGYRISDNFSIVGHTAVSLLAGERQSSEMDATYSSNVVSESSTTVDLGKRRGVVLGAEGKIGLAYTSSMSQGNVSVEGGYGVVTYHDGIDFFGVLSSPFNLDGFYLKAKFVS